MAMFCTDAAADAAITGWLPELIDLLRNPAVQEVSGNFEPAANLCRLYADFGDGFMRDVEMTLTPAAIIAVTRTLATKAGKSLNPRAPFLNCTLANGFRYHAVLSPSSDGPSLSIRTHHRRLWSLTNFLTTEQTEPIKRAVIGKKTLLVAGATNSGKTSLLNALINLIPIDEGLLVIEDEPELQIRPGNVTRRRATEAADLAKHVFEALRDRPDRIVIGEVRGSEAAGMQEAFATGHAGGLSTIHANGCDEALARL
jgi:Flp pilus assembly CpaF family ATPase